MSTKLFPYSYASYSRFSSKVGKVPHEATSPLELQMLTFEEIAKSVALKGKDFHFYSVEVTDSSSFNFGITPCVFFPSW